MADGTCEEWEVWELCVFHDGVDEAGEGEQGRAGRGAQRSFRGGRGPRKRQWRADDSAEEIGGLFEVGFFDGAGFEGEGQGVWICRDADGGDFEEFLLEIAAAEWDRGRG